MLDTFPGGGSKVRSVTFDDRSSVAPDPDYYILELPELSQLTIGHTIRQAGLSSSPLHRKSDRGLLMPKSGTAHGHPLPQVTIDDESHPCLKVTRTLLFVPAFLPRPGVRGWSGHRDTLG